ncbi:hypothetical protein CYY_007897 [Polysphondylium violaceum]|uniref:Uncharacterized protein n=1 Tax=Polysphondylium violaceum TaxID=133409 RepID=A0A8J4UXR5_9MYCE|nr:hypothetical protein CYY_007897 [Polysphondylium violaceum]
MSTEVEGQKRYSVEVAIARKLNSANENVRKKALYDMTKLIKKSELTEIQFMKLWKGLFLMVYITDKPIVQEEVNTQIAKATLACQGYEQSYLYLKAFFETMEKHWDYIDQYRLDKFYSLIRKMLHYSFVVLSKFADEDVEERDMAVTELVSVLKTSALHPSKVRTNGIVLHVADIFLEELYKVTQGNVSRSLSKLLLPFLNFLAKSDDTVSHKRIKERVFFRLVSTYSPFQRKDAYALPKEGISYDDDELANQELFPTDYLVLSKLFFKCAASKTTLEENRSSLYSLSKTYKKANEQVKELESFLPFLPAADELKQGEGEEEEEEVEGEEEEEVEGEEEQEEDGDEDEEDDVDQDDDQEFDHIDEDEEDEDDDEIFEDDDEDIDDEEFDDEEFDDQEESDEEDGFIPIQQKQTKNTLNNNKKQQVQVKQPVKQVQQPIKQTKQPVKQQPTKQQPQQKQQTKVSKTPTPTKAISKPTTTKAKVSAVKKRN